ncbi:Uncharacterised protein [Metamycoplasma alkalescens]|uniref:Uncharacterized protein n=1 Tax=Metamycoplasma alkalescens TaxID=45363 RepID=A0A3B0P456_9BACT|nr:Uncharacterised protein [Metamycoplasma alkalescens]
MNVSYTFVLPIGYFGFYFPCSTIIKMFRYVKTKEQLKKLGANGDPLNMLNQMFANNASQNELETEKKLSEKNTLPFVINDLDENKANNQKAIDFRAQLETLDDKKIILMAQKLNIFGAAELSREQLIDKIIMIFENIKKDQDQNNNENDLAKKDNKTNEDETKFENDKKEEKDSDEIQ